MPRYLAYIVHSFNGIEATNIAISIFYHTLGGFTGRRGRRPTRGDRIESLRD